MWYNTVEAIKTSNTAIPEFTIMSRYTYTVDDLRDAVKSSTSLAGVIRKLGLVPAGGNYETIKRKIAQENIDTKHFLGQAWSQGRKFGPKRKLKEYLINGSTINSYNLKNRLLKEGLFSRVCSNCNLTHWLGDEIPLELDHINGVSNDNRFENLRLLCPNCHALTPTYRGKNKFKPTN